MLVQTKADLDKPEAKGFTPCDLVRQVFPKADKKTAEFLLWECTGFPGFWTGDDPIVCCLGQLNEVKAKFPDWDGDPDKMPDFSYIYKEIDDAMKEYKDTHRLGHDLME